MIYTPQPVDNYQLVSINMTSSQSKYYFPDLPNLRKVKTIGMSAYIPTLITTDNNGVSLSTNYNRVYVTLVTGNDEFISKMDLIHFNGIYSKIGFGSCNGLFQLNEPEIFWSKSYVEYGQGTLPAAVPSCLCFGVYYKY